MDEARMGSAFGYIEVGGARENNLMSYTWAKPEEMTLYRR
jgi:hypothetical protein